MQNESDDISYSKLVEQVEPVMQGTQDISDLRLSFSVLVLQQSSSGKSRLDLRAGVRPFHRGNKHCFITHSRLHRSKTGLVA